MSATVKLPLKPLAVPNFVGVALSSSNEEGEGNWDHTVPVKELDEDALEELAYGFLLALYKKANKHCPFYRPARSDPEKFAKARGE